MNAGSFPGGFVANDPSRPALIWATTGETMSYEELDSRANQTSHLLRRRGIGSGEAVSIWAENSLDYPALWWGALYAGSQFTLISTRLTVDEVRYILHDSDSRLLMMSAQMARRHADSVKGAFGEIPILVNDQRSGGLPEFLAQESTEPLPEERIEGKPLLYSSGTTGQPKAIVRRETDTPVGTKGPFTILCEFLFSMSEQSVCFTPAPLYHAAPYGLLNAATSLGAAAVISERFDAEEVLQSIERYRITHAQFVPTMFIRLLNLPEETKRRYDLSSLQCVIHSAAPCPVEIKERLFDWWGPIIHEYYSGTEGAGFTYCSPTDWLEHKGSVGKAMIGTIHVVGEDGTDLSPGEEGVIYFSGGLPFEYRNDHEKTAGAHLSGGRATLGDVGRVDEDGFLYLTDRLSNMIITGGVNVYPQEAENALAGHPAVEDVAVIGVPDAEFGEQVRAVVQLRSGWVGDDALSGELIRFCRERLADVKCPRSVEFRADLPREPNGKLIKRKLRDEYWRDRESRLV